MLDLTLTQAFPGFESLHPSQRGVRAAEKALVEIRELFPLLFSEKNLFPIQAQGCPHKQRLLPIKGVTAFFILTTNLRQYNLRKKCFFEKIFGYSSAGSINGLCHWNWRGGVSFLRQ